jgi:Pyruvate/2-oxoacid:ferredoxin oxidoreductase delta subunit
MRGIPFKSDIYPSLKSCPNNAIYYVEDEEELLGGRMEIDSGKCKGCGKCAELCCGKCIELK